MNVKLLGSLLLFVNFTAANTNAEPQSETSSTAWITLTKDQHVVVEMQERAKQEPLIRGTLIFSHPISRIRQTLTDVSSYTDWLPDTAVWQIISSSKENVFVYARHNLAWPMKDRDYRVRYSFKELSAGGFQVSARATTEKGPKPIEGVIRLTNVHSVWTIKSLEKNKTRVEYRYDGTLGGDLPGFVKRSAWKHEPVSLLRSLHRWLDATSK